VTGRELLLAIHGEDPYAGFEPGPVDLQGWNSEAPLFAELIAETRPRTILELGSWKGASAIHMGRLCRELGLQTTIVCVDTWLGSLEFVGQPSDHYSRGLRRRHGWPQVYYQFLSNVVHAGLQGVIVPFPQTASHACDWLLGHGLQFDLAYVDGAHDFTSVQDDITNAMGLLRTNLEETQVGRLFGDDYGDDWPGVSKAVQAMFPADDVQVVGQHWVWVPPWNHRPYCQINQSS
jgi:hypothetical protein